MSFKISRENLKFALDVSLKALASREQEEITYRSVRIQTGDFEGKKYAVFCTNGGFNSVQTAAFEVLEFRADVDILVEGQKLSEIISKATVDLISISIQDEENVLVIANGQNKLRYMPGSAIAEFPIYAVEEKLGEMEVSAFVSMCKLATPFTTEDVHKAPLIGICLDKNRLYATDEFKAITLNNIGLNLDVPLNFTTLALELVKSFSGNEKVEFYLGRNAAATEYSHVVLVVAGFRLFILKYQTEYPSSSLDEANSMCEENNVNKLKFTKTSTLQALNRISIFADDNDLLSLTPAAGTVTLEVLNAKTGEQGKEEVVAIVEVSEESMGVATYVSLENFRVLFTALPIEEIELKFADKNVVFLSCTTKDFTAWLTTKRVD